MKSLQMGIAHDISREEVMHIVRDHLTPHFPPQPLEAKRQKIRYSDTNYQLLIAIIEAVTGQPLHMAFEELLYTPLALEHTCHPGTRPESLEPATLWFAEQPMDIPSSANKPTGSPRLTCSSDQV